MKKTFAFLFLLMVLPLALFAQEVTPRIQPQICVPGKVPPPMPIKSNLNSKKAAVAATGVVGKVESIHSAFVNWTAGGFDGFSIGTGSVPNGPNRNNIFYGQGLNTPAYTTNGFSFEELRLAALTNGNGPKVFTQGEVFYFHLYNGGTDTVVGPLSFVWQNLGTAGNTVAINIETLFGENGLGGFPGWQATNMMDFYSKVLPIIAQVYGPSSHAYTVNVINDGNAVGTNTFYNGPNRIATTYTADAYGKMLQPRLMVHELMHAWRDNVCLSMDKEWHYETTLSGFEEGMAEAAAVIVMDKFTALYPNYFPATSNYLNVRWGHEAGYAFDWDYDFQNHTQLTTTDWWSSDQGMGAQFERYGTGSAAFYKMYVEDNNFFKKFNAEYYRRLNADHTLLTSRPLMVDICKTVLPKVEERPTEVWIDQQRILDCKVVPGKKVHMLSYQGADGNTDMTHDNRIHLYETQPRPGANEWSWDDYDGSGNLTRRWFHQLNNLPGRLQINNYTTGLTTNALNFRNNDMGYGGPNQGPCIAPNLGSGACFPTGIDGHAVYTSSADLAITAPGVLNSSNYYTAMSLNPDRYIFKIQTTGLYVYNINFTGQATGKYYRLHGNGFINKDGLYSGVRNNADTPVAGKMYVEQKAQGEEPSIAINNGTLIAPRTWASVPELNPNFQGGRTDRRYSKPGKIHAIYVNTDCTQPQKIDFRNIGFGAPLSGVQMFLFNVDDFKDIIYTETMPTLLCQGKPANFSVSNNYPTYLDTDTRITYQWKKNGSNIPGATAKTYTIPAVTTADGGLYALEITSFGCVITRTQNLVVTPSITLVPTVVTPSTVCAGSTIALDVNGTLPTGTTYAWTGPNGYTNATKNPTITNAQAIHSGTYEVTCTVKDCDGVTDLVEKRQIQVTVNPILKPIISCGAKTANSVTFDWTAVTGATNYDVSYQVNALPIQNIGAIGTVLTYQVTGLQPLDNVVFTLTPVGAAGTCFAPETTICQSDVATGCIIPGPPTPPTDPSSQTFCTGKLVSDLIPATPDIKWYATATGGTALASTAVLTSTKYYASQTVSGCESTSRYEVDVTVNAQANAGTNGTLTVCAGTTPTNAELFGKLGGTPDAGGTWTNVGNVYTYTVTATAPCTANATATVTVTTQPAPNAGTNGALTVCLGVVPTDAELFAQLTGTPDAGGTWTNVGNVYTYTVTATAPCTANDTATVTVTETLTVDAGTNGTLSVCAGTIPTDAELFAALGGSPSTGGVWTHDLINNVHTYTLSGSCAVNTTATVTVTEISAANAGINGTLTVCAGTTPTNAELFGQLTGTPDAGGTWTNVGNVYTYTVTATAPCTVNDTATVTVTTQAAPNAGTNGALTVCAGTVPTNAELFAKLGGTPDAGGTWTTVGNVYTYTVNALAPCTTNATATVTVTTQAAPNAGTNGTLTVCAGTTPTNAELFGKLGGTPDAGGTWTNAAGVYTYTVNALAPCTGTATATVTVTTQAAPNAGTNGTLTVCAGTTPTNADLFGKLGGTPDAGGTWTNAAGVYTYTVNAIAPCTRTATATVTVTTQAAPNAGTNGTLTACAGTTPTNAELFAKLGGTPDAGGTWTNTAGVYTYTVNAIAPCTGTATATVTVTTQATPNAGTNGTLTVCAGTTPTNAELFGKLGGTPDAGGTWTNAAGVYTYTVNAIAPCTGTATATVTVTTQATPNAGTNGTLTACAGTTPTNAELFGKLGGTPDAGGTWTTILNVYTYTVNAIAPCTGTATATVTVVDAMPIVTVPPTQFVCDPANTTLTATIASPTVGYTFAWTTTDGTIASGANTLSAVINTEGTYVFTITNTASSCSTALNVVVKSRAPRTPTTPSKQFFCVATATVSQLQATGNGIKWYATATGGTALATTAILTPGMYYATQTNATCESVTRAITEVVVDTPPVVVVAPPAQITCANSTIVLDASLSTASSTAITYNWTGGKIVSGAATATPTVSAAGTYTVTVTNTDTGCHFNEVVVVTQNTQLPQFTIQETGLNEHTIQPTSINVPYEYSINESNNYTTNPVFKIVKTGYQTIYVKDAKGCINSEQHYFIYTGLGFPQSFSPNGDGLNEYWYPTNTQDYPNLEVTIYDRYNRILAKFKGNQVLGWDGNYNGKPVPSGDYWYVLKTNNPNDNREFIDGMTLFR